MGRISKPKGIGLFLTWPLLARQRSHRFRFVEPHIAVELPGQDRLAIVAPALGFRPVDDADEALEPRLHQPSRQPGVELALAQGEEKPVYPHFLAYPLVTLGQ